MDPELAEYLDRRFGDLRRDLATELGTTLRRDLGAELRTTLRQELGTELRTTLRQELAAELGATLRRELGTELRTTLWQELGVELRTTLRQELAAELGATLGQRFSDELEQRTSALHRHFDVVAESLMAKIELVAEGVRTVDQKVDRLAAATDARFAAVDRRLLHLTARLGPPRRR